MVLLIDTNILLDIYLKREKLNNGSNNALKLALLRYDSLYFSCSSLTDFYYIVSKTTHDKKLALSFVIDIVKNIKLATVDDNCIFESFKTGISDFEDAIIDAVATSINADIILTRNKKDFINSTNKVLTPEEYLEQY